MLVNLPRKHNNLKNKIIYTVSWLITEIKKRHFNAELVMSLNIRSCGLFKPELKLLIKTRTKNKVGQLIHYVSKKWF